MIAQIHTFDLFFDLSCSFAILTTFYSDKVLVRLLVFSNFGFRLEIT